MTAETGMAGPGCYHRALSVLSVAMAVTLASEPSFTSSAFMSVSSTSKCFFKQPGIHFRGRAVPSPSLLEGSSHGGCHSLISTGQSSQ